MRAPRGRTNQRNRRVTAWVAPYVAEWLQARAAAAHPEAAGEPPARGPVSRYLAGLVMRELERERQAAGQCRECGLALPVNTPAGMRRAGYCWPCVLALAREASGDPALAELPDWDGANPSTE